MPTLAAMPVETFLEALASGDATPGGGAAVALTGAQAAALFAMVVRISGGPADLLPPLDALRLRLTALADADALAFNAVMAAYRLPRTSPAAKAARTTAVQAALHGATEPPLAVMQALAALFDLAGGVAALAKPTVASDVAIGVRLMAVALRAARHNVDVNLAYIADPAFKAETEAKASAFLAGRKGQRRELLARLKQPASSD